MSAKNFRVRKILIEFETLKSNEALSLYDKLLDMERLWKILKFQTQDVALIRLLADMDTFINHLTKEMFFSGRTNYEPETKTKNFQLSFHRQERKDLFARTLEPKNSNRTENQSRRKINYQVNSSSESILLTELALKPELETFLPGLDRRKLTEDRRTFLGTSVVRLMIVRSKLKAAKIGNTDFEIISDLLVISSYPENSLTVTLSFSISEVSV